MDIVLTPTSYQACMKHGINPEVLRSRTYESFWGSNLSEEIQHMRHGAYARRRVEMMRLASEERNKLLNAKAMGREQQEAQLQHQKSSIIFNSCSMTSVSGQTGKSGSKQHNMTPQEMLERKARETSALIRAEQQSLVKVRNRQKKELLHVLQAEAKRGEIQREAKERTEREAQVEDQRRKEREENARRASEECRLREIRRKAAEDAGEEMKRLKAQEVYEHEQKLIKEKDRQEIINRKKAQLADQERMKRQEAHRLQTEQKQELDRLELEHKMAERNAKEKEHQEKVELKRQQDRAAFATRRKQVSDRIMANQEAARQLDETRKVKFCYQYVCIFSHLFCGSFPYQCYVVLYPFAIDELKSHAESKRNDSSGKVEKAPVDA